MNASDITKKFTAIYGRAVIQIRRCEQRPGETVADMLNREGIADAVEFLFHGHPLLQGEEKLTSFTTWPRTNTATS